jgi:tetratricopeptide (TPR) repeat protein
MGFVRQVQGNGPAALQELKRAVELKPSYAQAHHWLGFQLFDLGRLDPAREHVSLAVELDPRHWAARGVLINVLLAEGEVETARAHLRQLSDGHPQYPLVRSFVLYHAEEWDELASVSRRQLEQGKNRYYARFHLARAGVGRGDTAVARAQLAKVREDEPSGGRFFAEGLIHAALDQPDSTFSAWRRAREAAEGARGPAQVLRYWYPDVLDPVRDDPRYRELIAEINRAWGLNPDGSLPDSVEMSFEVQPEG